MHETVPADVLFPPNKKIVIDRLVVSCANSRKLGVGC